MNCMMIEHVETHVRNHLCVEPRASAHKKKRECQGILAVATWTQSVWAREQQKK